MDITGKIGDLFQLSAPPEWPMYSFSRPSWMLWDAIANALHDKGWSDSKIKDWLQSRATRWALDGSLGDAIDELGRKYAATID
jgi:hypothetical protein